MKKCIKCEEDKEIDLFIKNRNVCKDCMKKYKQNQYKLNNKTIKEKKKSYYEENKFYFLKKSKEYYESNKESKLKYQKEYYNTNKQSVSDYKKKHSIENKDKITKYKSNYQKQRRKTDSIFKFKSSISSLIRKSIKNKGFTKKSKTYEILGCDFEIFKEYIENKFTEEMNWENHGTFWDIDHIIPLCTAITEEDIIRLNHYTNLQPLDSNTNRNIKRDKVDFYIN